MVWSGAELLQNSEFWQRTVGSRNSAETMADPETDIDGPQAVLLLGPPRPLDQVPQGEGGQRVFPQVTQELHLGRSRRAPVPRSHPDDLLPQTQAADCAQLTKSYHQSQGWH